MTHTTADVLTGDRMWPLSLSDGASEAGDEEGCERPCRELEDPVADGDGVTGPGRSSSTGSPGVTAPQNVADSARASRLRLTPGLHRGLVDRLSNRQVQLDPVGNGVDQGTLQITQILAPSRRMLHAGCDKSHMCKSHRSDRDQCVDVADADLWPQRENAERRYPGARFPIWPFDPSRKPVKRVACS